MYILSQDRTKIINTDMVVNIQRIGCDIFFKEGQAKKKGVYLLIANYETIEEAKLVFEGIYDSLISGHKSYEMPEKQIENME